ncbi:hypothetical protein CCACVL1_22342 [Corchorus capsularis]|uniref:BZIP domain-containing protein n=1 Tax=Corchorus capsularis TaxID=210143 RepID=A0A1R3H069_COCAP|nr:hypothetical protein CCACVL1_22342 [Corchorus capsularis]
MDHKFSGRNVQGLDLKKFVEDIETFENVFFPPQSMNYNPNYVNPVNFDQVNQLLNEGNGNSDDGQVVVNVGGQGHGSNMQEPVQVQMNNNGQGNEEENVTRKRYKKDSVDDAQKRELRKLKNRTTAARAFQQKKAYVEQLELEVQELSKKNAYLKKSLQFGISSLSSGMTQRNLRRTASAPLSTEYNCAGVCISVKNA